MAMKEYDTFMLSDPAAMPEDQQLELIVRDLTPADRRYKIPQLFCSGENIQIINPLRRADYGYVWEEGSCSRPPGQSKFWKKSRQVCGKVSLPCER